MFAIKTAKIFSRLLTLVNILFSPTRNQLAIHKKKVTLRTLQSMNIGENKYKLQPYLSKWTA
jgi:hypothetical protein